MGPLKKRLPAEVRKKQILKCAVRVFAESNYRSAKVADIAAAAGISEAMVYKYFPTKKSIFLHILEHMSARIITFWQEELEKAPDALIALRNMGFAYYERMKKHPNELKVQFQAISEIDDEDIAKRLRKDHLSYISFIRSVLKQGIQQGTIRTDINTYMMALLFNGAGIVLNMMKLLSFDKSFVDDDLEELMGKYIENIKA